VSSIEEELKSPTGEDMNPFNLRVEPSKVKLLSQVRVFASPPTLVNIELLVALETRGTLIMLAPSDVLRFPETTLATIDPLAGK